MARKGEVMIKETEFSEHAGQLRDIIEKLATVAENTREVFVHQQSRSLVR